ncbi:MAG: hypothetical protein KDD37_00845 [Bdellovibrionales bacterium]|nr:hypothetical protein [Bdellovibrionales bacterium]
MKFKILASTIVIQFVATIAMACQVSPCPGWGSGWGNRPNPNKLPEGKVTVDTEEGVSTMIITGDAANELYKAMKQVRTNRKTKVGQQISCNKLTVNTKCVIQMNAKGEFSQN